MKKNNQNSHDKSNLKKKEKDSKTLQTEEPFLLDEGQTFISLKTLEDLEKKEKQKKN